jgi:plastocyanin
MALGVTPLRSLVVAHAATTLVIGVDHTDTANQQPFPPFNRVFEYRDFFSRSVSVHQGDTIDFRYIPFSFHSIGLATSEAVARQVYPLAFNDVKPDGSFDIATATGAPKLVFGNGNYPVTNGSTSGGGNIAFSNPQGPPVCGVAALGEGPCHFAGGNDIEIIGPTPGFTAAGAPQGADQLVIINALPGTYAFFDMLHPGMSGQLTVVPANQAASTQAQIDAASQTQFQQDQAQALQVESALNQVPEGWGPTGSRQFVTIVGAAAPHVQIDEMLPNKPLSMAQGDTITYVWADPNAGHSLGITPDEHQLPPSFGYDCGPNTPGFSGITTGFDVPPNPPPAGCTDPGETASEFIGDPGTSPSGSRLLSPTQVLDAGHLLGVGYGVQPSAQTWQATTGSNTQSGTYHFVCNIHDWMTGSIGI